MSAYRNASLAGAFLAGITVSFIIGLPRSRALERLAILLGGGVTIYVGAVLSSGQRKLVWIGGLVACAFIVVA